MIDLTQDEIAYLRHLVQGRLTSVKSSMVKGLIKGQTGLDNLDWLDSKREFLSNLLEKLEGQNE